MLVTADKFYGVLFNKDKISSIRAIKREEAMEFVEQVPLCHFPSSITPDVRFVGGPSSMNNDYDRLTPVWYPLPTILVLDATVHMRP
jgi:hypothetical protein